MLDSASVKVEDKLYQNRYHVDEGRPHVRISPEAAGSATLQTLVKVCPAGCYEQADDGTVEVVPDGCMECGTCRILTDGTGLLEWSYPRGGYGIQFKFG
ncbi:ferredoxin family protein [Roseospira goensis]|uniref:Ferredoxin-like protein n=1 Tax=Roseospira goensis TaxID=391922 RepID=A0A7W6S2Q6_9PROT|nr:ferredoxin family protein [Roseospira goensis]MBB4287651.1 ferredoxin like protein [Roseospira goensis]